MEVEMIELTNDEKNVLNSVFKGVKSTTRNTMLMALFAAKPADDGSVDAQAIINLINALIVKMSELEPPEMEELFAGIPYEVN
jgi:pyruvate-formate lyase